jgi:hypothetical protein
MDLWKTRFKRPKWEATATWYGALRANRCPSGRRCVEVVQTVEEGGES